MTDTLGTPVLPVVRIAILAHDRITDVVLPTELPLRELLPAIQRLLGTVTDPADQLSATQAVSLAPIGKAPFSLDASLDTVGVIDGDLLVLQPIPAGPAAPGIVEDIADAAVIFSESRRRPWGPANISRMARAAMIVVMLAVTALAIACQLGTDSPFAPYGVNAVAALAVIAALLMRTGHVGFAFELSVAAVVPIAAALSLAVPGELGAPQFLLGAAGVAAWSLINMIFGGLGLAVFTATAVVAGSVLLVSAAAVLWQLPPVTLGCGLLLLALLVTIRAAHLSALWARLPLPVIPAPGDPAPAPPSQRVLLDLPRRVKLAEAHQTGFIAGAVLVSVLGSLAVVWRAGSPGPWAWYLVVATSVAAVLRARVWDTARCKAWLLVQPFLVLVAVLTVFLVQEWYAAALWTVVLLVALAAGWAVVATNPRLASPETYSLPARRLLGITASAVDASLIPVMAYLVGLFTWVLNR